MPRLRHSNAAFVRGMQMSGATLFVLVEGKTDRFFYATLTEAVCSVSGTTYQICSAQELPAGTGGKEALLSFFQYLRSRGLLVDSFKVKKTAAIFFLDKDIDDI